MVEAGYEYLVFDAFNQAQHRADHLCRAVQVAGQRLDLREHRAGHTDPQVVAEGLGDQQRLRGEVQRTGRVAAGQCAVCLVGQQRGQYASVVLQALPDGLVDDRFGLGVPVAQVKDDGLQRPRATEHEGVPARPGRDKGLLAQSPRLVEVRVEGADRQQVQAQRAQPFIADVGGQFDRSRGRVVLDVERAGGVGDEGKAGHEARLKPGALLRCAVDRPVQEADSLPAAAIEVPEPRQRRRQLPAGVGFLRREAPFQRRAQVVVLDEQHPPPPVGIQLPIRLRGFDAVVARREQTGRPCPRR